MKVQSLSVVVPGGCPNKCKFCVARMTVNPYKNQLEESMRFRDLYMRDFTERLAFARDNGCNTVVLTGDGEPLFNTKFLETFAHCNEKLAQPFRWIELQTSGVSLDEEKLRWLRNTIRVSTISLSLSSFDSMENADINQTPENLTVDIYNICQEIKKYDFNLRLSVNLTRVLGVHSPKAFFQECKQLGADQITMRKLYASGVGEQAQWVKENILDVQSVDALRGYIRDYGQELDILPYGASRYALHDMSVVLDTNCMPQVASEDLRYLILRSDCKLYTRWDTPGSILF